MFKKLLIAALVLILSASVFPQPIKIWEKNVGSFPWLANDNNTRGIAYNPVTKHLLAVSKTGTNVIAVLDANTGAQLDTLKTTGITGGTNPVNLIRVADDGAIYVINLTITGTGLKIYRWANETAVPTVAFSGDVAAPRAGDSFGLSGTGTSTVLYISGGSSSTKIDRFTTTDGLTFTKNSQITVAAGLAWGGIAPISTGLTADLWVKGANTAATHINSTGTVVNTAGSSVIATTWFNINYLQSSTGKKLLSVVGTNNATDGKSLKIYDITTSETSPVLFQTISLSNTYNANTNASGDIAVADMGDGVYRVFGLVTNNGIMAYDIITNNAVKLTSPVGGESFYTGQTKTITWGSNGVTNVKLEYSTDNGFAWQTISASTAASAGSYIWVVPNTASTNYKIRISDAANASVISVSSSVFSVRTATLTDGLKVYYPFNGNANNENGSNYNLTVTNANLTSDRFGELNKAYEFNGNNSKVRGIANSELSLTNLSISAWIRIKGAGNYNPRIFSVGNENSPDQYYSLVLDGTSNSRRLIFLSFGNTKYSKSYIQNSQEWHHCIITAENNRIQFYIDGIKDTSYSVTNNIPQFTQAIITVGCSDNGLDVVDGAIDDIRLYNRVLSDSEINSLNIVNGWNIPFVNLTNLKGGENIFCGETRNITWASRNIVNAKLEYSIDNGGSWQTIIASTLANAGSYFWTVPNTTSTICKVRISDASNSSVNSISNSVFTIKNPTLTDGLIAYYPFNGNANDSSGNANNGTVNGATLTYDRFGIANKSYLFNGTNNTISVLSSSSLSKQLNSFTFSSWVYVNNWYNSWASVFAKSNTSAFAKFSLAFTSTNLYNSCTNTDIHTGYSFSLKKWYHILTVWDGSKINFFVNDSLIGAKPFTGPIYADTNPLMIGVDPPGDTEYLNGRLDDIRIYDRVLLNNEVHSLFIENGWNAPFVKLTSQNSNESYIAGQMQNITWEGNNVTNVLVEYSTDGGNIWQTIVASTPTNLGNYIWTVPNTPSTNCKIRISSTANSSVNSISSSVFTIKAPALEDGLVSYFPFNGNANDESGNENNGVVSGATLTTDRFGNANFAYSFNGSSSYITTTKSYTNPYPVSYSVWFKTTTTTGGKILGFGGSKTGTSSDYDKHIYMTNEGKIYWGVYSGGTRTINSNLNYNDGKWHQVFVSLSSQGISLYINGNFITKDISSTSSYSYTGYYRIGYDGVGGWPSASSSSFFNGSIDDIRIYNRTLLDSEIKSLYDVIKINAPNGGENWQIGSTKNITWTSNNSGNYKIEYSTNNGTNWLSVIASTPAWSGSYAWIIPNTPALNSCQVKITSVENPTIFKVSDQSFSIISNQPVAAPVLSLPANNSTNVATNTTMKWLPVSDAVNYQLQVSVNPSFGSPIFDDSSLLLTEKQLSTLLLNNKYYWRVRAKNLVGWGSYSEVWAFTPTRTLPATPVLVSPANYSILQPQSLKLNWLAADGAENYRFQLAKDSLFTTLITDDSTVFVKYFQLNSLQSNTKYYWRVKAQNSAGNSSFSTFWSFKTRTGSAGLAIDLPITITDNSGASKEIRFGLGQNATDGVDIDLNEDELPPVPPTGIFDARFNLSNAKSLQNDYRQGNDNTVGTALHEIQYQTLSGNKITLSWALPENVTFRIQDAATNGTLVDVTATGIGNFTVNDPAAVNKLKMTVSYKLGIPLSPVLYLPPNNSTNVAVDQAFKWSSRMKASNYKLEIATDSLFTNVFYKDTTLTDTSKTVPGLANNAKYFWRVSAKNTLGSGIYSPIWNFKTIPAGGNVTTLMGRITDSRNGNPIDGAVVTLLNFSATSDQNGSYTIANIPNGVLAAAFAGYPVSGTAPLQVQFADQSTENTFTISVSKTGFVTYTNNSLVLTPGVTTNFDISITPTILEGKMRIVLNWGSNPNDLDAHIKTPSINGTPYHIYYGIRGDSLNVPFVVLDMDKRGGYGPETVTLHQFYKGTYSYYVRQFSLDGTIPTSNAVVQIYTPAGLIKTYNVPSSGSGKYWYVCNIDGETKTVTDVNQIVDAEPGVLLKNAPPEPEKGKYDITVEEKKGHLNVTAAAQKMISSWEWNFGDGSKSIEQNPLHTYTNPGTYTVSLKVTANGVEATTTKQNYVNVNGNQQVQITSPNGKENWQVGSSHNITWTSANVNKVKLEYTTNNGTNWTLLGYTAASAAQSNWTIPNTPTTQAKVKISDSTSAAVFDESDTLFTISSVPVPTVTITSPNGKENWQVGSAKIITWTSANINKVKLEYTTNNGTNWILLGYAAASAAQFNWTILNTPTTQAKVKISDSTSAVVFDESDTLFTISSVPAPTVTVTSPNGKENWQVGSSHNITWTSTNINKVKLEYTTNNGTNWTLLGYAAASAAQFNWTVPNTPTTQAKLKISDSTSAAIYDESDTLFTISAVIVPAITVKTPNGGENWLAGSTQSITWTSTSVNKVKIEYSTNNGTAWIKITDSVLAVPATFSWAVPNTPSTQCKLKISDAANANLFDLSDNAFSITSAANALTIKMDTVSGSAMDSVVIPIRVSNFNNVAALTIVVQYDTTKLTFGRALNWHPSISGAIAGGVKDKLTVAWDNLNPISIADDKLVDLKFFFKGNTQTQVIFVSKECEITDPDGVTKPAVYINGLIIPGVSITGIVAYDNTSATPLANVQVMLRTDTVVVKTAVTDANGVFKFASVSNGTYNLTASSTIAWGGVNSTDALQVRRHIASVITLTGLKLTAADVNLSSTINSTDALFIRRRIAASITTFPAGDWAIENPSVTVNSANITQDIKGICIGDVNGSYTPALSKSSPSVNFVQTGEKKINSTDEFVLPVRINENTVLGAVTLVLNYPTDQYEIISVNQKLPEAMISYKLGKLILAWDGIEGIEYKKGESILELRLKAKNKTGNNLSTFKLELDALSELADKDGKVLNISLSYPELGASVVKEFNLGQNYPNPFNPTTNISYQIAERCLVTLWVYDVMGKQVMQLVNEQKEPGKYSVEFNAVNLPSGVYFYQIEAGSYKDSKKLLLLK